MLEDNFQAFIHLNMLHFFFNVKILCLYIIYVQELTIINMNISDGLVLVQGFSKALLVQGVSKVVMVQGLSKAVLAQGVSKGVSVQGVSKDILVQVVSKADKAVLVQGIFLVGEKTSEHPVVVLVQGILKAVLVKGVSKAVLVQGLSKAVSVQGVSKDVLVQGVSKADKAVLAWYKVFLKQS